MKHKQPFFVLSLVLSWQFSAGSSAVIAQADLRSQVIAAITMFPNEAALSRKQLMSFGDPGVPFIVEILQSDSTLDILKKTFLVDVIANIHGKGSEESLKSLLAHGDPYVRGLSASYAGKLKLQSSLPLLIDLLDDKAIYKTIVETDPSSEQVVLVRDVAIESLQKATGLVLTPRRVTKEEQVRVWKHWWKRRTLKKAGRSPVITPLVFYSK